MSKLSLSKFSILFTRPKFDDYSTIQIVPSSDDNDSYNVSFTLREFEGASSKESTEVWKCPKASIRQYVRNCVTVVAKDSSAQRFTFMELQIPMFPTCLTDIRGSSVDQLLNIAFEHLDLISTENAKYWPDTLAKPTAPSTESKPAVPENGNEN